MMSMFNKVYRRMGYFYQRTTSSGSTTYSTYSKESPTSNLLKRFEEYKKDPTRQAGFGIGLVTEDKKFSTICVDIDAHGEETGKEGQLKLLVEFLNKNKVICGVELNEHSKGYHVWLCGEECDIANATGLLQSVNKLGTEVFPMVNDDGEAIRFIRLPGLYKDGTGRSYSEKDGKQVFLTTAEAVEQFFQNCYNADKSLLQIIQLLKDFFTTENPLQGAKKIGNKRSARSNKSKPNSKCIPCSTDELNRVESFLTANDDVFESSRDDRYNFNSNNCEMLLQETEVKTLLITGKSSTLADDILVGIDRVDRSNLSANSFAVIDRYSTSGIIKSISFLRNRDNEGVVLFDDSRRWTVDDLVKRAADIPELDNIYSKVKLEKILTPLSSAPYTYNYRVEYDFLNDCELKTPQIYTQENKANLGVYLGVYIKRVLGAKFTKALPIKESESIAFLNSLYVLKCSYYCGGIINELTRISETVYSEEEVKKAYETILDIVNLDTAKTTKEIFKTFLEVLFKKASMRLYNCLPDENDDVAKGVSSEAIKSAIKNRINVPLTNALVVMGESGSGKTTLLRLLCEGISSVVKFGGDNKIHPTRSVNANMISNSSLDSRMDVSASLFANLCSYFTEYNPKPAELEVSQAFLVGFLSKLTNTERYAHEKHIISTHNMCCFLGFDTDCSSIFSFKAGNKRRFLPIWLKKRVNQNGKNLYKISEATKYIVEYYLNTLLKNNVPFFTDDYVFSEEIAEYIAQTVSSITKVKNDLADTIKDYLVPMTDMNKEIYQLRNPTDTMNSSGGIKGIEQYANCQYAYIHGKTVSSILNQFYGWKERKLGSFKEDSQEVSILTDLLKENGIEKKLYKVNGKVTRMFRVLFVVPTFVAEQEPEEQELEEQK